MRKTTLSLVGLLLGLYLCAQSTPDWVVDGIDKKMWMTQLETGDVLLINDDNLQLVDNQSGEMKWALAEMKEFENPKMLEEIPFIYHDGKVFRLINAQNGEIVMSMDAKTKIDDIHYYWEQGYVIMELTVDKADELVVLDVFDKKTARVQLAEKKDKPGMFSFKAIIKDAFRGSDNRPFISDQNTVAIVRKKDLHLVSIENREVIATVSFDKDIKMAGYAPESDLLFVISDKKKLHAVSIKDGTEAWVKEYDKDVNTYAIQNEKNLLVHAEKKVEFLNGNDGSILSEYELDDSPSCIEFIDDRIYLGHKDKLKVIDESTLEELHAVELDKNVKGIYKVGEELFIRLDNSCNIMHPNDMTLTYEKNPEVSEVIKHMTMDGKDILVGLQHGQLKVLAVEPTGKKIWDKTYDTNEITMADETSEGLLVITDFKFDHIELEKGKSTWDGDIDRKPSFVMDYNQELNKLAILNEKRPYIIDMGNGSLSKGKDEVKFKDFDFEKQTPRITYLAEGAFVKGSNSIALFDHEANLVYNEHFKKSDNSGGLVRLATLAVQVGAMATGNTGKVMTAYQDGEMIHKGSMVDGIDDAYGNAAEMDERRRRLANAGSLDLPFVFTKLSNDERGFAFLNTNDGKAGLEIEHDDKSPNYIVDSFDKVLLVHDRESKQLKGYLIK